MTGASAHIVPAEALDLVEHACFQRAAFASRLAARIQSEAYYAWKYATPAGRALVARVEDGGRVVASATAAPLRFARPGGASSFVAWQLCDLATAPTHRRRGLMRLCLAELLDALGAAAPVYCIPNAASAGALARAGLAEAARLRLWLATRRAVEAGGRSPDAPGLDLADPATLAWRFEARPGVTYRAARAGEGAAVAFGARPWFGAELAVGIDAPLGGRETRLAAPFVATLASGPPPWRARATPLAPRLAFARAMPGETRFGAAEWDVP